MLGKTQRKKVKMKNGQPEKNEKKPKHSIHDYKPKKRYTRAEREKIEAGKLLLELIRRGQADATNF